MSFYQRYKNYILGAALVVLLFIAYTVLFGNDNSGAILQVNEPDGPGAVAEQELLSTLLELKSVRLEEDIFVDSAFQTLRDFSQQLVPRPVGRNNPFAPVGASAAAAASSDTDL